MTNNSKIFIKFTPKMLQELYDPDYLVRSRTAELLGRSKDERAVEPLIKAIQDPSWSSYRDGYEYWRDGELWYESYETHETTLTSAINALAELKAVEAVPILLKLLDDDRADNQVIKSAIAQALGKIGDPEAINRLLEEYLKNKNLDFKKPFALSLDKLGWKPENPAAAAEFYLILGNISAIKQTGHLGADQLLTLMKGRSNGDHFLEAIFESLTQMGDNRVADHILNYTWLPNRKLTAQEIDTYADNARYEREILRHAQLLAQLKDRRASDVYRLVLAFTKSYKVIDEVIQYGDPSLVDDLVQCANRNNWMHSLARRFTQNQFPEGADELLSQVKQQVESAGFLPYIRDIYDDIEDTIKKNQQEKDEKPTLQKLMIKKFLPWLLYGLGAIIFLNVITVIAFNTENQILGTISCILQFGCLVTWVVGAIKANKEAIKELSTKG